MAKLGINTFNELNIELAFGFDGKEMPDLGAAFTSKMSGVTNSFENTAPKL